MYFSRSVLQPSTCAGRLGLFLYFGFRNCVDPGLLRDVREIPPRPLGLGSGPGKGVRKGVREAEGGNGARRDLHRDSSKTYSYPLAGQEIVDVGGSTLLLLPQSPLDKMDCSARPFFQQVLR